MAQLVVQTAFPGDLLLSIPLIKKMRDLAPKDPVVLLCREHLGEIFLKEKLVDEVVEVNKRQPDSLSKAWRSIKTRKWTRVICPHESYRSAFLVRSLKVQEASVAFRKWWNGFAFTDRVEKPMHLPDALRQLSLLKAISPDFAKLWQSDIDETRFSNRPERTSVSFANDPTIPPWASMQIRPMPVRGKTVFIAPGSVWPTKRWQESGFAELAKRLIDQGEIVEFVGSPGEQELCEHLAALVGAQSSAGKTSLYQLVDRFRHGKILVANDSGAMHAAAVAGLPTVAIFGPTVLNFGFRPWQTRATVVQRDLPCRPCATHGGRRCPIGTHACMIEVKAEHILSAIIELTR